MNCCVCTSTKDLKPYGTKWRCKICDKDDRKPGGTK